MVSVKLTVFNGNHIKQWTLYQSRLGSVFQTSEPQNFKSCIDWPEMFSLQKYDIDTIDRNFAQVRFSVVFWCNLKSYQMFKENG